LRDIGRIFEIPEVETNMVCKLVVTRSGGDARTDFCLMDTFTEFEQAKEYYKKYKMQCDIAIKLESRIRHRGLHAAGIIITKKKTSELIPIENVGGDIATAWEKKEAENIGLIKFDILGLKTLSVIDDAMKLAGITELPRTFDDKKVYDEVFKKEDVLSAVQALQTELLTEINEMEFRENERVVSYRLGLIFTLRLLEKHFPVAKEGDDK